MSAGPGGPGFSLRSILATAQSRSNRLGSQSEVERVKVRGRRLPCAFHCFCNRSTIDLQWNPAGEDSLLCVPSSRRDLNLARDNFLVVVENSDLPAHDGGASAQSAERAALGLEPGNGIGRDFGNIDLRSLG